MLIFLTSYAFVIVPVQAELWSTPVPILYMDKPISGICMNEDGSTIAFSAGSSDDREIYLINSDGTNLRQVTNDSRQNVGPHMNGDGSKIVYNSFIAEIHSTYEVQTDFKAFIINSDGTGIKQLPENKGARFPTITSDGQKIALLQSFNVSVINPDGTDLKTLNDPKAVMGDVPSISGDGSKVIFIGYVNSNYELFVVNSDGSGLTQITDGTDKGNGCAPAISGDGTTIVYRNGGMPIDGSIMLSHQLSKDVWSTPTTIALMRNLSCWNPTVTINGSKIFFTTRNQYSPELTCTVYAVKADGTGLKELCRGPYFGLIANSNGSKLALVDTTKNVLYVMVDLDQDLQVPNPATPPLSTPTPTPSPTPKTVSSPTPTPSPSPTITPTPTERIQSLTAQPTSTEKDPSPTPNPSPTIPEFSWLTILPLFISLFAFAVAAKLKFRGSIG